MEKPEKEEEGVEVANLEALAQGEVAGEQPAPPVATTERFTMLQESGKIKSIGPYNDELKERAWKTNQLIINSLPEGVP